MAYILMNKNREIAQFAIERGDFGDRFPFSAKETDSLPIGFKYIENWLENRKASKHNAHLRRIMADCGCDKTEGFIRVTHAASINDTFWVKAEDEDISWEQVSFYRNNFNEVISRLAFEGVGLYGIQMNLTSPELSTDGSFRKCWAKEDGEIFLYKRGSSGARNAGLEPYCEVLGAEIANRLIQNSVSYKLVRLHGELASKCKAFTSEEYGYVPITRYPVNHSSPSDLVRFYGQIGSEDDFRRMVVLDALTFNVDRHAGNHGVLVNNETQEAVCMAPVFDMNMSMLPYVERDEFEDIGRKLTEYGPRIGDDFTRMGQQAVTPSIRSDLIGLKGFTFSFRGDDRFPEWRVKLLEEYVNRQVEALLCRDVLYTRDVFVPREMRFLNDILTEVEPETERNVSTDVLTEKAEQLAGTLMASNGSFSGYFIEDAEDDIFLHIILKRCEHVEFVIGINSLSISAEKDGISFPIHELEDEYPGIRGLFSETARVTDSFLFGYEEAVGRENEKVEEEEELEL